MGHLSKTHSNLLEIVQIGPVNTAHVTSISKVIRVVARQLDTHLSSIVHDKWWSAVFNDSENS